MEFLSFEFQNINSERVNNMVKVHYYKDYNRALCTITSNTLPQKFDFYIAWTSREFDFFFFFFLSIGDPGLLSPFTSELVQTLVFIDIKLSVGEKIGKET